MVTLSARSCRSALHEHRRWVVTMTTRDRVLVEVRSPRCAREICERLGLGRKATETTISRLTRSGLIQCLTPTVLQSRLYGPTSLGELLLAELDPTGTTRAVEETILNLYAWVQAGSYRRWTLKHQTSELTPKALRNRILQDCVRMGTNHVHSTLRSFASRNIATRNDGCWYLTALGWALRDLAFGPADHDLVGIGCKPWADVIARKWR